MIVVKTGNTYYLHAVAQPQKNGPPTIALSIADQERIDSDEVAIILEKPDIMVIVNFILETYK